MADPAPAPDTIPFKIDGKQVHAKKGETILQVALREGSYVPHYCYHPSLSIAGNCRMCLVMASNSKKPVIACATLPTKDLEVDTKGPEVKKLRENVMEFLLINHPLDCPVCDQAGECDLQQFSFDYGKDDSRFIDEKNQRHTKDLGPLVRIYGNRCIVCTRCVRFCDEIAGTGELTVVQRGDRSVIDSFPGAPIANPISGCAVDVCPVGALLSSDFIHKTRVWLLETTPSVCSLCATGCSIDVDVWKNDIQRLRPRTNPQVNQWWMCDRGRLGYKAANSPERPAHALVREKRGSEAKVVPWRDAVALAAEKVLLAREKAGGAHAGAVVGVASGYQTLEELHLFRSLVLGATGDRGRLAALFGKDGPTWATKSGTFKIEADGNPNRRGVALVLGEDVAARGLAPAIEALEAGSVAVLWIASGVPEPDLPARFLDAIGKAAFVAVMDAQQGPLAERADVLIPGATAFEKDGTFVNAKGIVQRVRPARALADEARPDIETLQTALQEMDQWERVLSAEGVFRHLAASDRAGPLAGWTYADVGKLGKAITAPASA